ncbi:MAG: DUF2950 family protein [Gammaproteobacteria bacterium]|nr:MAG: DUF2950 family protein [Gammaproteobacteria bacterium]
MTQGVAPLAWPASQGRSGIKTFQVNPTGMVYKRDLEENTAALAATINALNLVEGWRAAVD